MTSPAAAFLSGFRCAISRPVTPQTRRHYGSPQPVGLALAGLILSALVLPCGASAGRPQQGIITTVAGGGANSNSASSADLGQPGFVAVDPVGNIFVSANFMNQVFKIDPAGNFSVLAGSGIHDFSGDGGAASSATLASPAGVATDRLGNIFIVDSGNQRVRRVDAATGIITTVAGNGTLGFSGDNGPATAASLLDPEGITVDQAGNLFIADYGNLRVRRVDGGTGVISTVVGNGTRGFGGDGGLATNAMLNLPWNVALDVQGNLFVADTSNYRIRRVDAVTQIITTVAGGGPGTLGDGGLATNAFLNTPFGLAIDGSGNLLIADTGDERIRRVDHATGIINTTVGNGNAGFSGDGGPGSTASLNFPMSIALDANANLIFADTFNNRVRRVTAATGRIDTVAGGGNGGDGGPSSTGILCQPYGLSVDNFGNIFIADTLNQRIRRVDAKSGVISTVTGVGVPGNSGDGGAATNAAVSSPRGVAADASGNVYVGDQGNQLVRRVDLSANTITSPVSSGLAFAGGVGVDGSGNLYIADSGHQVILRMDTKSGGVSTVAGNGTAGYAGDNGPALSASLNLPQGVAVDSSGNLFIADTSNNVIRRVDAVSRIITTVAGNGTAGFIGDGGPATSASLSVPERVAVDTSGNLFIADLANNRVRRVDVATGVITTVAGNGTLGFAGDNGPATSASLGAPADVGVDIFGNVYIADLLNNRIRRVLPAPNASASATRLTFANQLVGTQSPTQMIALKNNGPQILAIYGIAVSGANAGDFGATNTCGATLVSGTSCNISVGFSPTAGGVMRAATLTITDSSSNSPQTIALTGTGQDFSVSASTSSISLSAGGTATFTVSITPQAGFNQQVQFTCTGAPALAQCTASPASVTSDGVNAVTTTVTVSTTAPTLTVPPRLYHLPRQPMQMRLVWLSLAVLVLAIAFAFSGQRRYRAVALVSQSCWQSISQHTRLAFGVALLAWALVEACGGGTMSVSHTPGTPAGTYSLTVTVSDGNLQHSTTTMITVR